MRFLIAVALCVVAVHAGAATLTVEPASQMVTLGTSVSISVNISGLGGHVAPSLGTYDLNVAFDPSVLSFTGVNYGDPVLGDELDPSGLGDIQLTTPGVGTLELFELSLDSVSLLSSSQPSAFALFQLSFMTIADGISPLAITINALGDENGTSLPAT